MSEPLSSKFSYYGRRPNQFFLSELTEMLCPPAEKGAAPRAVALSLGAQHCVTDDKNNARAHFTLAQSKDGKEITLHIHLMCDGHTYDSHLKAVEVRKDKLFEITELVFDNKPEKLKHRWEITSVLGFLGRNHLSGIAENKIPAPHKERGQFGKFGRFFNRMLADNPDTISFPPYF